MSGTPSTVKPTIFLPSSVDPIVDHINERFINGLTRNTQDGKLVQGTVDAELYTQYTFNPPAASSYTPAWCDGTLKPYISMLRQNVLTPYAQAMQSKIKEIAATRVQKQNLTDPAAIEKATQEAITELIKSRPFVELNNLERGLQEALQPCVEPERKKGIDYLTKLIARPVIEASGVKYTFAANNTGVQVHIESADPQTSLGSGYLFFKVGQDFKPVSVHFSSLYRKEDETIQLNAPANAAFAFEVPGSGTQKKELHEIIALLQNLLASYPKDDPAKPFVENFLAASLKAFAEEGTQPDYSTIAALPELPANAGQAAGASPAGGGIIPPQAPLMPAWATDPWFVGGTTVASIGAAVAFSKLRTSELVQFRAQLLQRADELDVLANAAKAAGDDATHARLSAEAKGIRNSVDLNEASLSVAGRVDELRRMATAAENKIAEGGYHPIARLQRAYANRHLGARTAESLDASEIVGLKKDVADIQTDLATTEGKLTRKLSKQDTLSAWDQFWNFALKKEIRELTATRDKTKKDLADAIRRLEAAEAKIAADELAAAPAPASQAAPSNPPAPAAPGAANPAAQAPAAAPASQPAPSTLPAPVASGAIDPAAQQPAAPSVPPITLNSVVELGPGISSGATPPPVPPNSHVGAVPEGVPAAASGSPSGGAQARTPTIVVNRPGRPSRASRRSAPPEVSLGTAGTPTPLVPPKPLTPADAAAARAKAAQAAVTSRDAIGDVVSLAPTARATFQPFKVAARNRACNTLEEALAWLHELQESNTPDDLALAQQIQTHINGPSASAPAP